VTTLDSLGEMVELVIRAAEYAENGIYTQALDESIGFVQEFEREMYREQRGPDGVAWAPLAPSTIAAKGHSTILVDTGRMFESLTTPQGTQDTVWMTGDNWFTFGTSVEYAHFHQTGTKNKDGSLRMVARPHVGVNGQVVSQIGNRLAAAVATQFNEGLSYG
jgi:phage gpG-like protein